MLKTNFKWERETRHEAKDRVKAEQQAEIDRCYQAVDIRDQSVCRVTGEFLTAGASDPHKRKERHHMIRRSRGGLHQTANVITVSAFIHSQDHAGKVRLTGDANLKDAMGNFCGVLYERITDGGWVVVRVV